MIMDTKDKIQHRPHHKPCADSALSASTGSPSDTPETDDLLLKINEGRVYADECPTVDLCRKLERERDQARQYAEQLRITNGYKANDEVIFPWENTEDRRASQTQD